MTDETRRQEIAPEVAAYHGGKAQKLTIAGVCLSAAMCAAAAAYYKLLVPEKNLLHDYHFCFSREMQSYQDAFEDDGVTAISHLRGPRTGYFCPEIYRRVQGGE